VLELRPYQTDIIERARAALRRVTSVLVQAPTGAGKTALATNMLGTAAGRGFQCGFVVHRRELIDQTILAFQKADIPYGVIAAGFSPAPSQPVQICAVDTLKNRLRYAPSFNLMVWDECHHIAAAGWRAIKEHFSAARHVGLSATPQRLDGKGLDDLFDEIVLGPKVSWLIDNKFLAQYRAFAPSAPDMAGVHTKMGDFVKSEMAEQMDKPDITGDVIKHYNRHARGKRAVVFCINIEHSVNVARQFREAGINSWHLDGSTDKAERRDAIQAFRDGQIEVLCNVDLFGEGFDLPAIEATIMLRPTQSLSLYLQQVGRSLRPMEGKERALILDHAGNIARHGLPDDDREWSLEGRKKKKDDGPKVQQCPRCYATHSPAKRCPECGYEYGGGPDLVGREITQSQDDLVEIDPEQLRRQRAREQYDAKSLDELTDLATRRGYRNPEKWAAHVWTARQAKQKGKAA
jgi:DNA repair protein RadD